MTAGRGAGRHLHEDHPPGQKKARSGFIVRGGFFVLSRAKSADITQREVALVRRWRGEGLLSAEGLAAVEEAARE